jgi:hypothetical protein
MKIYNFSLHFRFPPFILLWLKAEYSPSFVLYFPPSSEIFSGRLKPLIFRSLFSSVF